MWAQLGSLLATGEGVTGLVTNVREDGIIDKRKTGGIDIRHFLKVSECGFQVGKGTKYKKY